jgi:hypothetical protein
LAVQIFTFAEEGEVEEPEKSLAWTAVEPGFFFFAENSRKGVRDERNSSI